MSDAAVTGQEARRGRGQHPQAASPKVRVNGHRTKDAKPLDALKARGGGDGWGAAEVLAVGHDGLGQTLLDALHGQARGPNECHQGVGVRRRGGPEPGRGGMAQDGGQVPRQVGRQDGGPEEVRGRRGTAQDQHGVPAHRGGARDVGVQAVSHHQWVRGRCQAGGGLEHRTGRLPGDRGGGPGGRGHCREDGPRSWPQSVWRRVGGVGVGSDQQGPSLDQKRGGAKLRVVDRAVPSHHDEVAPGGLAVEKGHPDRPQRLPNPGLSDDEGRAARHALALEHVRGGQPRRHDLLRPRPDTHGGELLRHLLPGAAGVVGQKDDRGAETPKAVDGRRGGGDHSISAVHDTVEIEENRVVPLPHPPGGGWRRAGAHRSIRARASWYSLMPGRMAIASLRCPMARALCPVRAHESARPKCA